MKKILMLLLCFVMFFSQVNLVFAATEEDTSVIEVASWDEFKEAFARSNYQGETYNIKLM